MSFPTHSKKSAEGIVTFKQLSSSVDEARQAATLVRGIANDLECTLDTRAEATRIATELEAQPTREDGARRDARMMLAVSFARAGL
jgi:hypothetical protein